MKQPEPSVAVLPFDGFSSREDDRWQGEGLADDLITELALGDQALDFALTMWALAHAPGAAYGLVVAHDRLLALSFALSLLACLLTIALTVVQRLRGARRRAGPGMARPQTQ